MARLFAFLRAVNVGGRVVTMEELRRQFGALGFERVETFIASGNVIFESRARPGAALERRIEERLLAALGYEVRTFVRTALELAAIAAQRPFPEARLRAAAALNVGFLAAPLAAAAERALMALRTPIDDFHVHGRELWWLCAAKQHESKFSNALFERKVGVATTFRGAQTVARLAAKYSLAPAEGP